jgi:hypothetical protein
VISLISNTTLAKSLGRGLESVPHLYQAAFFHSAGVWGGLGAILQAQHTEHTSAGPLPPASGWMIDLTLDDSEDELIGIGGCCAGMATPAAVLSAVCLRLGVAFERAHPLSPFHCQPLPAPLSTAQHTITTTQHCALLQVWAAASNSSTRRQPLLQLAQTVMTTSPCTRSKQSYCSNTPHHNSSSSSSSQAHNRS